MTMAGDGALQVAKASDDEHGTRIAGLVDDARAGRAEAINGLVTEFTPMLWQVARASGLQRLGLRGRGPDRVGEPADPP